MDLAHLRRRRAPNIAALVIAALGPRPAWSAQTPEPPPASAPATETLPLPAPAPAPVAEQPPAPAPPPTVATDPEVPEPTPRREYGREEERPASPRRRGGVAAVAGGLSLFGVFYIISAISGLAVHDAGKKKLDDPDTADRGEDQIRGGRRLLIPLVGPWVAFPYLTTDGKEGAAILGSFQLFGALSAIAGAVLIGTDNRLRRSAGLSRRWLVSGSVGPRQAGAVVLFRF